VNNEEKGTLSYFWSRKRQGESVYVKSKNGINFKIISRSESGFICCDGRGMKIFVTSYKEQPVWTKGKPFES
jgi:hypothetical protein